MCLFASRHESNCENECQNNHQRPFVYGCIQLAVQLMCKGHPLNTLEKHAPICNELHSCHVKQNQSYKNSIQQFDFNIT